MRLPKVRDSNREKEKKLRCPPNLTAFDQKSPWFGAPERAGPVVRGLAGTDTAWRGRP